MSHKSILLSLLGLCGVAALLGLAIGQTFISPLDWFQSTHNQSLIIWKLRAPRVLNGLLVGACLAGAGAAFQGILKNPLADPYILGVSSGAGLGATIGIGLGFSSHWIGIPALALGGAIATIYLVHGLVRASQRGGVTQYILAGIIVNAFFSSLMLFSLYLARHRLMGTMQWLMGDLGRTSYLLLGIFAVIGIGLLIWLMTQSYSITLIAAGEETAESLGVSINQVRWVVFITASGLTGLAVASGGIIGFVGLVIPHVIRIFRPTDFRWLIPQSALLGGAFLVLMDTLSRSIFPGIELPIGILTSCIGAPFFLGLWLSQSKPK